MYYNLKEIQEAREAGWQAKQALERAIAYMRNASGWGILDLLGGNLLTGMVKHAKLDHAQEYVDEAKSKMKKFQKELQDIDLPSDMKVNMEGFIRIADYLFDNVFVDIFIQSKIRKNMEQLEDTAGRIDEILEELNRIEQMYTGDSI